MESSMEISRNKRATRKARRSAGKRYARSRVSNGNDVLPNTDGRSFVVRRYRDITDAFRCCRRDRRADGKPSGPTAGRSTLASTRNWRARLSE
jgi:hypothetical protein